MSRPLFLVLIFALSPLVALADQIAVIGAGVAGLTAAHDLKRLGHQVVVFEREDRVGGLVDTVQVGATQVELGAILVTPSYETIQSLIEEYQVETRTWPSEVHVVDPRGRISLFKESLGLPGSASVLSIARREASLRRYPELQSFQLRPFEHEDIFLPLNEFARRHGWDDILAPGVLPLTLSGYSFPDEIPALYALKLDNAYGPYIARAHARFEMPFLSPQPYIPGIDYLPHGFSLLWRRVAQDLDVRLNSEVVDVFGVQVSGRGRRVAVRVRGSHGAMIFDRVVVATHPEQSRRFLRHGEASHFFAIAPHFKTQRYLVTVLRTPGFSGAHRSYIFQRNLTSARIGHSLGLLNFFDDPHLFIAYQTLDATTSWAEAERTLREDVHSELGIRSVEIVQQKEWGYFPHIPSGDLSNALLGRIEQMQGQGGIYHVGAAWDFESTENAAAHARWLVRRYFR